MVNKLALVIVLTISLNSKPTSGKCSEDNSLILVHAVFRHGDRTPDKSNIYPNDPYKNEIYYPHGYGQLTNRGKLREYQLGLYLRKRYNKFLGDIYTPDILDARSTGLNRTKMSLELVLAGLFEPKGVQRWYLGLKWQPIPYNYWPTNRDKILLGQNCPNYVQLQAQYLQTEEARKIVEKYRSTLDYLEENTGWEIPTLARVVDLYLTLQTEYEWGLVLPEWTKKVFPEELNNIALDKYAIDVGNVKLRRLISGYLLQKIVNDSIAKSSGDLLPQNRKLFLYSGHESTLAPLLLIFGQSMKEVPPYGACIIIELHKIRTKTGIKMFYYKSDGMDPVPLKLPGCNEFCSLKSFYAILEKYFPNEDECGYTCDLNNL